MVAQDEWIDAKVILVDVERRGQVAVYEDEVEAGFLPAGWLSGARQHAFGGGRPVRVTIEIQRRFGGLAPRALLGAEFAGNVSGITEIRVGYGVSSGAIMNCPSRLWFRSLTPGMSQEFATGVLTNLLSSDALLPAGVLRVDRAAFDEVESSAAIFGQAADVLAHVVSSILNDVDVESTVRVLMGSW